MDQEPTITSGQPSTRVDEDIDLGLGSASDSDSGSDSESDSESNASLGGDATTDNLVGENRDDAVGLSLENRKGKAKANPRTSAFNSCVSQGYLTIPTADSQVGCR